MATQRISEAKAWVRIFFVLASIAVIVYLGMLGILYLCQRQLEYLPPTAVSGTPKQRGVPEMSVVKVKTADNLSLASWFVRPRMKDGEVVVFFHGTGVNIGFNNPEARGLIDRGYGVFMGEYRGFAGNPGTPTEDGLYDDGRAAMRWLKEQGFGPERIVLFGDSLGTGIAVQMALEYPVAGLVLEAPYDSALHVAEIRYPYFPIRFLMKDRFDSLSKISKVHVPLLIVHGTADVVVPIELARGLFDAANEPKQFIAVKGAGHPPELYAHESEKAIMDWLDGRMMAKQ